MAKLGKMFIHALIIGMLVAILVILVRGQASKFQPGPLSTVAGPAASMGPSSIMEIVPSMDCVPGPSSSADYYTSSNSPGGLCGASEYVNDQIRDYSIVDGVGGSLLEK